MKREIPKKNYLILAIILVVTVAIVFYLYLWHQTYEEGRTNYPIMSGVLSEINLNEIDNYITENSNVAIYVSKIGKEEVRSFEKKFITTINKYQLNNKILYLNLTNINSSKIKDKYQINNKNIINTPNILIFQNNELVDIYEIDTNDYNFNKIINYLENYDILKVK